MRAFFFSPSFSDFGFYFSPIFSSQFFPPLFPLFVKRKGPSYNAPFHAETCMTDRCTATCVRFPSIGYVGNVFWRKISDQVSG